MQIKAKLIIAMAAMCLLTTTALSQGGPRDGPNGGPEREMWQGEGDGMMLGPNDAPSGQNGETEHGQPPVPPRFKGCNTDPQNLPPNMPIKPPSDKPDGSENKLSPNDAPHGEPAPWTYNKPGDGQHGGPSFGFAGHDGHMPPRSIMEQDRLQVPPKKSMMEEKHHRAHKGPLKPLNPEDLPGLPQLKSMMDRP
ncbi:MAG TPA: hypothetical protein PKV33_06105 [Methanothrix sp.]|nr:hypothetical protein [Methanothrix sp.]